MALNSMYTFDFTFTFFNCIVPFWISPMGKFGSFPGGEPAAMSHATQPAVHAWSFLCFHNPPNSDMDYQIFNICKDVNACLCTWGCMDTVKESALKVDSGRKIPCRTGGLNLHQWHASSTLYQLSHIATTFACLYSHQFSVARTQCL